MYFLSMITHHTLLQHILLPQERSQRMLLIYYYHIFRPRGWGVAPASGPYYVFWWKRSDGQH